MPREIVLKKIDPLLILLAIALPVFGVLLVYSATWDDADQLIQSLWFKQLIYILVGWGIAAVIVVLPSRFFQAIAWPLYFISLFLLFYVAWGGGASVESKGAGRWIQLPLFNLQPSEVAKIGYLLVLARYLTGKVVRLESLVYGFLSLVTLAPIRRRLADLSPSRKITSSYVKRSRRGEWEMWLFPLFAVPFFLVLKQPDLGTALVFITMTFAMFFWSGMPLREIFLMLSVGVSVLTSVHVVVWALYIVVLFFVVFRSQLTPWIAVLILVLNLLIGGYGTAAFWNKGLEDHQRSRILTFLDPERDERGAGYQVRQSFVAIGSGGVTGKGFLEGSQTNLDFLPEEHTDFIFGVLGEQFGFVGAFAVITAFLLFLSRALMVTTRRGDPFGHLIVIGAVAILAFHIVVNIAMTIGLMPVTGLPLPFLSYGGSFMMTVMVLWGLIMHVRYKSTTS